MVRTDPGSRSLGSDPGIRFRDARTCLVASTSPAVTAPSPITEQKTELTPNHLLQTTNINIQSIQLRWRGICFVQREENAYIEHGEHKRVVTMRVTKARGPGRQDGPAAGAGATHMHSPRPSMLSNFGLWAV